MADTNDFSDIKDNFDTIKTLLNSIRAQGILNTSDVDKLLEGINSKLDKINTEEDIDIIKAFLSELKKNLDERHEVLISKFGAIESLFSNLLKNSTDAVKKTELQELFDIVATNLSVFSREVVSQKETLTDITLRLDAMRSDDSQKKDIIKSISTVRNDIEKVNNGFDSIVISLNENFKTVLKTISEVDQSDAIKGFSEKIEDIINSTNTILSAIQLIDKKNDGFEKSFENLATQDDTANIKKGIVELSAKSQELTNLVDSLVQKSYKMDSLGEKIDASVNIIAGLKAEIEDKDDRVKTAVLEKLSELEEVLKVVSDNKEFEEFRNSLQSVLGDISKSSGQLKDSIASALDKIGKLNGDLQALDINNCFKSVSEGMEKVGEDVKEKFASETDKLSQLMDANITRTMQEISSNAEVLNTRIKESHSAISGLCEKSFEEVSESIIGLKGVVAQLDENNVSANNAIFSNITDRLAIFENSLKTSLEKQEDYLSGSSNNIFEQITNIKNITDGIDYKLDSNAIDFNNTKKEYKELTEAVNNVLALDFVEVVKDVKAELFAVKEDLSTAVETSQTDLSETLTKDLFGKYELVVSRLDSVEDQLKIAQAEALKSLDEVLTKISASIVDILSYVSTSKEASTEAFEEKLDETVRYIQDSNLNYIDSVHDVVDAVREKIEDIMKQMNNASEGRLEKITSSVQDAKKTIQQDLLTAYDKLDEIKLDVNSLNNSLNEKFEENASILSKASEGRLEKITASVYDVKQSTQQDFAAAYEKLNSIKNDVNTISSELKEKIEENAKISQSESEERLEKITSSVQDVKQSVKEDLITAYTQLADIKDDVSALGNELKGKIDENAKSSQDESEGRLEKITSSVQDAKQSIKADLASAYTKLADIKDNVDTLTDAVTLNKDSVSDSFAQIISTTGTLQEAFDSKMEALKKSLLDTVSGFKSDLTCENADNMSELKFNAESIQVRSYQQTLDLKNELKAEIAGIIEALKLNILGLSEIVSSTSLKIEGANKEVIDFVKNDFTSKVNDSVDSIKTNTADVLSEIEIKVSDVVNGFDKIESSVTNLSTETTSSLAGALSKMLENFSALNASLESFDEKSAARLMENSEVLRKDFDVVKRKLSDLDSQFDEDLSHQISIIEGSFESLNLMLVDIMNQASDTLGERIKKELSGASAQMSQSLSEELEQYKVQIAELFEGMLGKNSEQAEFIKGCALELNKVLADTLEEKGKEAVLQIDDIGNRLKEMIHENVEVTSADYDDLKVKLSEFTDRVERQNNVLVETIRAQLDDVAKFVDSNLDIQAQEVNSAFEEISSGVQKVVSTVRDFNNEWTPKISEVQAAIKETGEKYDASSASFEGKLQSIIDEELKPSFDTLNEKLRIFFDENMMTFVTQYTNSNTKLSEDITAGLSSFRSDLLAINERLDKDELSRLDIQQANLKEMQDNFNKISEELKENVKADILSSADMLNTTTAEGYEKLGQTLNDKVTELQAQIDNIKQNSIVCRDVITKLIKEQSELISEKIEKETDILIGELIERFNSLVSAHKDDMSLLTTAVEDSVSGYIIDAVNDLKSYMDVKTDSSVIDGKLDSLRTELSKVLDDTTENINRLLQASVFADAISDLRATNEVLINTMSEKLNSQIRSFIGENVSAKIDDKFNLLDKKFVDTIVEKYEEVKMLSTQYNKSFEQISGSVSELVTRFADSKDEINNNLKTLVGGINKSVDELKASFADLKAQIMNKSFDEAFHESVRNQIKGIEELIHDQLGFIEDINDLCGSNLPEIVEVNTLVKHSIAKSLDEISAKLSSHDEAAGTLKNDLNNLKSDIITRFIDVFNQISFVTEQEEILDFIQEKHSELITILSHIVTTTGDIEEVKEGVSLVDNKLDVLKEDIDLINEKLTSIMSSDGDIDYVYSFRDLESDIANLRIVLNEMKEDNKSQEFADLISSTNNIYEIVNTIKSELPKFEAEEFKKDFNNLAEDIVSISTRTNKLILTSDESYKTLQDNLQDFKLVIDDLDERTRNFAHESGIDKLDVKLAAINTMIKSGAQTNQVFNQVFEYLAEWVDKAGEQLAVISDKVDTLDDIGQIRVMLEDLRAEAQDNTDSAELVSALEQVFDKQTKRISSLEAKLDKMIVATNVNSKKSKTENKPIEDALNKFLSEIEGKFISQQDKINSLETKLEEVVSLMDNKDTAQLTKKVGGMDRQLAKLNKSIEKIASNVVEK